MPTGYTADIENDISFEEYALRCSRAFGATAMQREDPAKDRPALREMSTIYVEWLKEAKEQAATLTAMTPTQRKAYGEKIVEERTAARQEYFNKKIVLRNKYDSMLQKVRAWSPPTQEHVELKRFMISQIEQSIDFDCNTKYDLEELTKLSQANPMKIFEQELRETKDKVERYTEEVEKEKRRVEESNQWILALYDSLGVSYNG